MSRAAIFWFGMAVGAWLNIWPPAIGPWWGFYFAYGLVAVALFVAARSQTPSDS